MKNSTIYNNKDNNNLDNIINKTMNNTQIK